MKNLEQKLLKCRRLIVGAVIAIFFFVSIWIAYNGHQEGDVLTKIILMIIINAAICVFTAWFVLALYPVESQITLGSYQIMEIIDEAHEITRYTLIVTVPLCGEQQTREVALSDEEHEQIKNKPELEMKIASNGLGYFLGMHISSPAQ